MKKEPIYELADRINASINDYSRTKTGMDITNDLLIKKALEVVWFVRFSETPKIDQE